MNIAESPQLNLKVSLISSYIPVGIWGGVSFEEFLEPMEGQPEIVPDLYVLMEKDVEYWLKKFGRHQPGDHHSAINFLAELTLPEAYQIAYSLKENLNEIGPVALTTFLPEISSKSPAGEGASDGPPKELLINRALRGLFRLAVLIGYHFERTPVVQMVAGSLIDRIDIPFSHRESTRFHSKQTASNRSNKDVFFVHEKVNKNEYFKIILQRLSRAFQHVEVEIGKLHESADPLIQSMDHEKVHLAFANLRVAFELEPGPLYLLNEKESIVDFCGAIEGLNSETHPHLDSKVGVNLDIAHWWMEGITPAFLDEHNEVQSRIFHSHISGHSRRAHFGDISLAEMHHDDKQAFREWLVRLEALSPQQFSGHVSLEFEAASGSTAVRESIQELIWLIRGIA